MKYATAILRDGEKIVKVSPLPNGITLLVEVMTKDTSTMYVLQAVSEDREYALYERQAEQS